MESTVMLQQPKKRLSYFDNAKFILIVFVVLAHAISPYKEKSMAADGLWWFLNCFHMPTFIFISGYLSKSFLKKDPAAQIQRIATYVILYLAAQITVAAFEIFILKDKITMSLFYARSSLWFLVCLIGWYVLLPIFGRIKWQYIMPCLFIFALIAGYDKLLNNNFSASRMIVHFPFFMAGYFMTPKFFEFIKKRWVKIVSVFVLAGFLALFVFVIGKSGMSAAIVTCNTPYKDCHLGFLPKPLWWTARLVFYISAALLATAFLSIIPQKETFFSKLGSRTLAVYILHRFVYLAYQEYEWYNYFPGRKGLVAIALIAIALSFLLSTKIANYPFDLLQKIKIKFLLKPDVTQQKKD